MCGSFYPPRLWPCYFPSLALLVWPFSSGPSRVIDDSSWLVYPADTHVSCILDYASLTPPMMFMYATLVMSIQLEPPWAWMRSWLSVQCCLCVCCYTNLIFYSDCDFPLLDAAAFTRVLRAYSVISYVHPELPTPLYFVPVV